MADKPSKSRKKKLRLVASGAWKKKTPKTSLRITASQRRGAKAAERKRNASVTGSARPSCKLDEQAKELGVYSEVFHCLTRTERKTIVSTALTARKAA